MTNAAHNLGHGHGPSFSAISPSAALSAAAHSAARLGATCLLFTVGLTGCIDALVDGNPAVRDADEGAGNVLDSDASAGAPRRDQATPDGGEVGDSRDPGHAVGDGGTPRPGDSDGGTGTTDAGAVVCLPDVCRPGCPCPMADLTAFWHADADTVGLDAFKGLQYDTSPPAFSSETRLTVVDDPLGRYGRVYRAMLADGDRYDGKARSEFYGSVLPSGEERKLYADDDLFFGWRSMVTDGIAAPPDRSNSGNLTQFKGDSSCGGPAIGMTIKHGRLTLRSEQYENAFWEGPAMSDFDGSWHDVVFHIYFSKDRAVGFVEFWLDGVMQTFVDGSTRYQIETMCPNDDYVRLKLGLYRSVDLERTGRAEHWIESPRMGATFAAVVPR